MPKEIFAIAYERAKILFVCSRNKRRSLTAETIFKNEPAWEVRSAGTEESGIAGPWPDGKPGVGTFSAVFAG